MKIAIKKKYVAGIAFTVCGILGYMFFVEIWKRISQESITVLITPIVFLASIIYIIHFWISLRFNEKLAEEVSKEASPDDSQKAEKIKKHLFNKSFEEAYAFNLLHGKIKFTNSWSKQQEIEKVKKR